MLDALATAGGFGAALTLLGACLWCSYALAHHLTDSPDRSARAAATVVIAWWLLVASFTGLAALGLFRLRVALPLAAVAAALVWWRSGRGAGATLGADLRVLGDALGALRRWKYRWVVYLVLALLAARMFRGLVAPPLGWDALTYHLVKPVRWIQSGGFAPAMAPDAWGYYEYFPFAGDVVWAWAMLPTHSDLLLGPAGGLVWLGVPMTGYALARALAATRRRALLAALSVGLLPCVVNYLTASYIDTQAVALMLAALLFLQRTWNGRRVGDAVLAVSALGLLAALRAGFVPLAGLGALAAVVGMARAPISARARLLGAGACLLALAVAAPPYLRAWIERGSPLYPLDFHLGPIQWTGNEQLTGLLSGSLLGRPEFHWDGFLEALFLPLRAGDGIEHRNLGPAAPLLLVGGLIAGVALLRRRGTRVAALGALLVAVFLTAAFFSDRVLTLRTVWMHGAGRHLAPAVAALGILAASWGGRLAVPLWSVAILTELWLALPQGWSGEDLLAMGEVLVPGAIVIAIVVGALVIARRWGGRLRPAVSVAAILVGAIILAVPVVRIRAAYRYQIWAAAAAGRAHDVHHLGKWWVAAFPLWQYLDRGPGARIAVTASFAANGHNWYRYPLFGTRFQNELVYVTPTRDGSIIDYFQAARVVASSSVRAWVERLLATGIEYVVALNPPSPEARAASRLRALFTPVSLGAHGLARAYRIDRAAARRWLRNLARRRDRPGRPGPAR